MPEARRKELRDRAKDLGVHLRSTIGDTLSHIHAADVVVCMAGYNTINEVLRFGKRAVVVPRPGPSAEQSIRTELLVERGLVLRVDPFGLTPAELARAVEESLDGPPPATGTPLDLSGVDRATHAILSGVPPASAVRGSKAADRPSPTLPLDRIASAGGPLRS